MTSLHADPESRTALLADADPAVRTVVRDVLYGLGCSVREVRRGDDALLAIRGQHPRLLVLAAELPSISGFSICRRVKRSVSEGTVVIVTGAPEDAAAALEAGADEFLPAPFTAARLRDHVEHLLARRLCLSTDA